MTMTSDYQIVKKELDKMNISFDIQTIQDISMFLNNYSIALYSQNQRLHIPAAAAIICQSKKIPTIGNTGFTNIGIKIENIMRHLPYGVSKEQYLQAIQMQIKKCDDPCKELDEIGEKVNKLAISFRIFKKYKNIFEQLNKYAMVPDQLASPYLSFFWLIFLLVKFKKNITQDLNQITKALSIVIKVAFSKYMGNIQNQKIEQCISMSANFPGIPTISEAEKNQFEIITEQLIYKVVQNRGSIRFFTLENLIRDSRPLVRLVDDISDMYQTQFRHQTHTHIIDEMTYLELTKDLTPQVHKTAFQSSQQISKVLTFGDDNQMDEEFNDSHDDDQAGNQSTVKKQYTFSQIPEQPKSSEIDFNPRKLSFAPCHDPLTPLQISMAKQKWANTLVKESIESKKGQIRYILAQKNIQFQDFENECLSKISLQLLGPSRSIHNKQQILSLFYSLVIKLYSSEKQSALQKRINLMELLCLSGVLYNQIIKHRNMEFKKYCSFYDVNIIESVKLLFRLGEIFRNQVLIKNDLKQLQKQILIKEIWDTDEGFRLLLNQNHPSNNEIMQRLLDLINERINQICTKMKIITDTNKMHKLMASILRQKSQLLEKNKLDQIIICAITVCLDLSKIQHNQALGTIFKHYSTSSFSFHSNLEGLLFKQGNKMSLIEFYNNVFLLQIQDIWKFLNNQQLLLTPLRQEAITKSSLSSIPPISAFSNALTPGSLGSNSAMQFRKNILNKKKEMTENLEEDDQPSPTFRQLTIKRSMTFGRSP